MSALAVSADSERPIAQGGLGAAAERYARLTLRKSEQTQATYLSTDRRFADWLSYQTGHPDPPPAALTADAVAANIIELEMRKAPATVKKERAINRLAKYLHSSAQIDATDILMIEGSRAAAQPRRRASGRRHLETRQGRRPRAGKSRRARTHLQSGGAPQPRADPRARRDGAALGGSTGADQQFDRPHASRWAHAVADRPRQGRHAPVSC
jgi:hypothetical protein